jgi:hypothetical protein
MRNPPPYADYLHEPTWQVGLALCDQVVEGNPDDLNAELLARYLRWLTGEVRLLVDDIHEHGIQFTEE